MKIVIADDSVLLRDRIKNLLNNLNSKFKLYEAKNGTEALELITEKEADLAILDIRMPDMNGFEVLKRIRELKIKIRVCILTNYPYSQYRKRCIEEGADYFLDKNIDFQKVSEIISGFQADNK